MSNRIDKESELKLQSERMEYAKREITRRGYTITYEDKCLITFDFMRSKVMFYPYSGWHTGKAIKDGRGLQKLIVQIRKQGNQSKTNITCKLSSMP